MLNAFRHHCCHHLTTRLARQSTVPSAQRLSASLLSSQPSSGLTSPHRVVLNAFRHHCCHHLRQFAELLFALRCSTPFGITAVITPDRDGYEMSNRCSTPFGITAVITPTIPRTCPALNCAQRLSASLLSSHVARVLLPLITGSAQRLSASLLSSLESGREDRSASLVLNAFRHHCCHHNTAAPAMTRPNNSAQRLSASLLSSPCATCNCFGESRVLNAFRHHCCHHPDPTT